MKEIYKEWKFLVGIIIMVTLAVAIPISLITNPEEFPIYLIALLGVFTIWMVYFLWSNKIFEEEE